jgi:hypothetical protein
MQFRRAPYALGVCVLAALAALVAGGPVEPARASGGISVAMTAPDTAGDVGLYSSLALDGSGNPVVSYFDFTNSGLKVLHCGNPTCTSGNSIASPDSSGSVGTDTSVALDASGNPVVSYFDETNGDLKLLHCGNPACTSGNTITAPDGPGVVGGYSSLALDVAGDPVVSYFDSSNGHLKVLHCGNPACSSGNSIFTADASADVGYSTSLAIDPAGNLFISYYDHTHGDLKVFVCWLVACTGFHITGSPDTAGDVGGFSSIALDIISQVGYPVISYYDATNHALKVLRCNDRDCQGSDESIVTVDTVAALYTSLKLDALGRPVVAYADATNGDLRVVHCGALDCSSGNTILSLDSAGDVGAFASLALDGTGNPAISYYDATNGDLKVLRFLSTDVSGTYDVTAVVPGFYLQCKSDVQQGGNSLTARVLCYIDSAGIAVNPQAANCAVNPSGTCSNAAVNSCPPAPAQYCGDGQAGAPPPGCVLGTSCIPGAPNCPSLPCNVSQYQFADIDSEETELTGVLDNWSQTIQLSGCWKDLDGFAQMGNVYLQWTIDAKTGNGQGNLYTGQAATCVGSPTGLPTAFTISSVRLAPGSKSGGCTPLSGQVGYVGCPDSDGDGCPDKIELSNASGSGGLRDPLNRWDYFNPEKANTPHAQTVADILFIIGKYGKNQGNPAYTIDTDRTAIIGGNTWNLGPPDGQQTVADTLAAVKQYNHNC